MDSRQRKTERWRDPVERKNITIHRLFFLIYDEKKDIRTLPFTFNVKFSGLYSGEGASMLDKLCYINSDNNMQIRKNNLQLLFYIEY